MYVCLYVCISSGQGRRGRKPQEVAGKDEGKRGKEGEGDDREAQEGCTKSAREEASS